MANIRARNGKLLFDFTYQGIRCREQTALLDNRLNRSRLMGMLNTIEAEIRLNRFVFRNYFPSSPRCSHFVDSDVLIENNLVEVQKYSGATLLSNIPTFSLFAAEWLAENRIQWKISHYKNVAMIFERYLMPEFGHFRLDEITRPQLIKYRASISEPKRKGRQGKLSNDWINHVMTPLRGILNEAALRFEFPTPFTNIKPLKIDKTPIEPFSLADVQLFLSNVREDFRDYYTVRFFTVMRTAEIDGLKWQYVNSARQGD